MFCYHLISHHSAPWDTSWKPYKGRRIIRAQGTCALAHSLFQLLTDEKACQVQQKGRHLYCLEVEEDLCHQGKDGWQIFSRQHLLSLILPGKPGMALGGQPTWWLFQHWKGDGCSNCEHVFLILLESTTVCVAYTQTFIPSLFLLRCLFLQSFLTYHLSKTDCSKN